MTTHDRGWFAALLVIMVSAFVWRTCVVTPHAAAIYYVSTLGSNSNPGSASAPWRNIAFGLSRLQPGDTLCVKADGVYSQPADRIDSQAAGGTGYPVPSGTAAAYVTVSSCGGARWTMRLAPHAGSCIRFATTGASYVEVADFVCDKTDEGTSANAVYISAGSRHNHFLRFEAHSGLGVGVGANVTNGDSVGNLFADCDVHHFGLPSSVNSGYGFYLDASESVIERCDIHDNVGWGVHVYNFSASAHRNIITSNRVFDNGTGGGPNGGILYAQGSDGEITNNVVWGNRGGITVYTGSQRILVANNTVTENGGSSQGIEAQYYAAPPVIANNIVWQSGSICDYGNGGSCTSGTASLDHNLTTDPGFTDPAKHDYTISRTSAAFQAGTTVPVTVDALGVPRPQARTYDVGAYEVPVTVPPIPPPDTCCCRAAR